MLRPREEPISRFLQRLGLSCLKLAGRQGGGDKKRAKKEKKSGGKAPGEAEAEAPGGDASGEALPRATGSTAPRLLDAAGRQLSDETELHEALQAASHVEIEGERLPLLLNPPSITKFEAFGRPLAGCPLTATLRCEFCKPEDFDLHWLRQAAAGVGPAEGEVLREGRVLWVPEDAAGQSLSLRADAHGSPLSGRPRGVLRVGLVEQVPSGWPESRLERLGSRPGGRVVRVVCYNILAVCYARTQAAVKDMYPYCPGQALDMAYRQPLIGREVARLDGDLVLLQEVGYAFFHKCLAPVFGDTYHMRISLKASKVSEGCAMLVRREAFEVLAEEEALFKNVFRKSPVHRATLREVCSKWPDFLTTILPKLTTVFQVSALRHRASGRSLVVANTHLFYHPKARHLRLLQTLCLLHQVQEMRERYRGADGELPSVVFAGDLNCGPESGAIELLTRGAVPSDHRDWDFCSQFAWREDEEAAALEEEGGAGEVAEAAVCTDSDGSEWPAPEALPETQWQPGKGVSLQSPVGPMSDAYRDTGLQFTNFVQGFSGILDWILTAGPLGVVGTLPGVSEEDLRPQGGLPSLLHPSDHLSIAADLEL